MIIVNHKIKNKIVDVLLLPLKHFINSKKTNLAIDNYWNTNIATRKHELSTALNSLKLE